jgi:RNA polymerase-binding transcription factor DksA
MTDARFSEDMERFLEESKGLSSEPQYRMSDKEEENIKKKLRTTLDIVNSPTNDAVMERAGFRICDTCNADMPAEGFVLGTCAYCTRGGEA